MFCLGVSRLFTNICSIWSLLLQQILNFFSVTYKNGDILMSKHWKFNHQIATFQMHECFKAPIEKSERLLLFIQKWAGFCNKTSISLKRKHCKSVIWISHKSLKEDITFYWKIIETQFKYDLIANKFKILEVLVDFLFQKAQKMPMSALSHCTLLLQSIAMCLPVISF